MDGAHYAYIQNWAIAEVVSIAFASVYLRMIGYRDGLFNNLIRPQQQRRRVEPSSIRSILRRAAPPFGGIELRLQNGANSRET